MAAEGVVEEAEDADDEAVLQADKLEQSKKVFFCTFFSLRAKKLSFFCLFPELEKS